MSWHRHSVLAISTLGALALLASPRRADACGGTFCDNLPDPMPVDQRGEDILFVLDGSTVEVHVRIEYTGAAERFAWVLPLQGIPEVEVGSEPLFTAMSGAVGPNWQTVQTYDCDDDDPNWGDDGFDTGGGFAPKFDLGGDDTGGPDIVFQETVGAFEVVVLQGGTAAEVIDFLDANDYAQDPDAEPILQEYLDEGFLFAAVKLTAGAEVEEIHPLMFRFPGDEPCVPIRLTRIAAEDDMGIRAYFLAQERWAPSNYAHVVLNPLAYNWQLNGAERYLELLSMAADEAGGQAFATEYAGPSSVVPVGNIYSPTWDETAFIGVDPIAAIDIIDEQGLNVHPLIRVLLMEFIPPPDGEDPLFFWNNIEQFAGQIDQNAWDDVAFAAALVERIIDPGLHAVDLLDTWPKLTRLNTTMSPNEMTVDPVFIANADLPDVDNVAVTTTEQVLCGGDRIYHVDVEGEDTPVCVPENAVYPGWVDMPWTLRIEQMPMVGPPQVTTDNAMAIESSHQLNQVGVACLADGGDGDGDGDGDPGDGDAGDGDSGDGSADGDGGTTTGEAPYDLPYNVTCGCATERGTAPVGVALGLLVLGLIGPWRRRRAG
jgi:MYXO-CTERM domain-containing protein